MKSIDLYSYNHHKGYWEYHLQWCPKYRYNALGKKSVKEDCELAIKQAAEVIEAEVLELAVMPDHVHAVVSCHPSMSQSKALGLLKGRSAYELFHKHPNLRKRYPRGHLWSRGSFMRTTGPDIENERRYVRNQKITHKKTLPKWAS